MTGIKVHAVALNFNAASNKGFDAFSVNEDESIYVLCDGANSCPDSGLAARWLCSQMICEENDTQQQMLTAHQEMLWRYPNAASTLLQVKIKDRYLSLSSLGDSFLSVYRKSWFGFGGWSCVHEMPRDLDSFGHPSQLIGSEVCEKLHTHSMSVSELYCIAMMSDGPGLVLPNEYISKRLAVLGRTQPSHSDLQYVCESLAQEAQKRGCQDDISVALIWIKPF